MDIAIMLEGQNGLNWSRLERIARTVEEAGFAGLYRSDHFTNPEGPQMDSLELWVSLAWLASNTTRIDFGPLVAPVSFRDPVMMARMALQIGELSGGRLTLGVGAGWQEREHAMFGYDLLQVPDRFARFEEALEVISGLVRSAAPVDFAGRFYTLREAELLPRPQAGNTPPVAIGGNGEKRTLPLVARYADEWNAVFINAEQFAALNRKLDALLHEQGRASANVRRSLMTQVVYGQNETTLQARIAETGSTAEELRAQGVVVGNGAAITEQLGRLAEAGLQRVMLQWLDFDDTDGLDALAHDLLPHFPSNNTA